MLVEVDLSSIVADMENGGGGAGGSGAGGHGDAGRRHRHLSSRMSGGVSYDGGQAFDHMVSVRVGGGGGEEGGERGGNFDQGVILYGWRGMFRDTWA